MAKIIIDKKGDSTGVIIKLSRRAGQFTLAILICLGIISFLIPFSVFLISEITVGIAFILTLILFWGSSIYFIRLFLWNKYGEEVYEIKANTIAIEFNYKLFKERKRTLKYYKLDYGFCNRNFTDEIYHKNDRNKLDNTKYYYFVLITESESIISNIPMKAEDINKLL